MGTSKAGVFRGAAAAFVLLLLQAQARAEGLVGRVVGVSDGDTLTVLTEGKRQVRVRLAEVDAPGNARPYDSRVPGVVRVGLWQADGGGGADTDRYGRTVERVRAGR